MTGTAKAVIDCPQPIPCDPCLRACPRGAIRKDGGLTGLPAVDLTTCTGCGVCIPQCPGQAITVIDPTYAEGEGAVSLPYEFLPLPGKGQAVVTVDAVGRLVGQGRVVNVQAPASFDHTPVVTVAVPAGDERTVRGIRLGGEGQ